MLLHNLDPKLKFEFFFSRIFYYNLQCDDGANISCVWLKFNPSNIFFQYRKFSCQFRWYNIKCGFSLDIRKTRQARINNNFYYIYDCWSRLYVSSKYSINDIWQSLIRICNFFLLVKIIIHFYILFSDIWNIINFRTFICS